MVDHVRAFCLDIISQRRFGHPGMPLGMAPAALAVWRFLHFDSSHPEWYNRDRFVLSNGHGSSLLYSLLHLTGFLSLEDTKSFTCLGSQTPGHPEAETNGVDLTTGPLGQGISSAVGMALAQRHIASVYSRPGFESLFDHKVFVFCGDGCLMEGVASEACSFAGHQQLGNLVVIYDANKMTQDGDTALAFTEDVAQRFRSYLWNVVEVENASENAAVDKIADAITKSAFGESSSRPTLVITWTTIGYGMPEEGTATAHGTVPSTDSLHAMKKKWGMSPDESFHFPEHVRAPFRKLAARGKQSHKLWQQKFAEYSLSHAELAAQFKRIHIDRERPVDWKEHLPSYSAEDPPNIAREWSGEIMNKIAPVLPELLAGSADLTGPSRLYAKCFTDMQPETPDGRFIRYGIREFGMVAIANGLATYGLNYSLAGVRLGALNKLQQIHICTHDSPLGTTSVLGPTHQPIEVLAEVRSIPGAHLIRPCDGNEVRGAYEIAIETRDAPTVISLHRIDKLPHFERSKPGLVRKGAYVIDDESKEADVVLIGTGSEIALAAEAATLLRAEGRSVRIVSMPCQELFDTQPVAYRRKVLPVGVPIVSIEAGSSRGWDRYSHHHIGVDSYGASSACEDLAELLGLTPPLVAQNITSFLAALESDAKDLSLSVSQCIGLVGAQRSSLKSGPSHLKHSTKHLNGTSDISIQRRS